MLNNWSELMGTALRDADEDAERHLRGKPLAVDLFCGLGGWAEGFLSEGYRVVGFDIERHDYGSGGYPGELVIQDVLTLHGSQFRDAAVIVASPPCQEFSFAAMPWKISKAKHPKELGLRTPGWWSKPEADMSTGDGQRGTSAVSIFGATSRR